MFRQALSLVLFCGLVRGNEQSDSLSGRHLRVGTINLPPTVAIVRNASGAVVECSGKLCQQIEWLSKRLNFSYELTVPAENTAGVRSPNGSWNGMIGQIQRREVDLALGPFAISLVRSTAINFVGYTGGTGVSILVKYPQAKTSTVATVKPFTVHVWTGWLVSIVIVTVVVHLISLFWRRRDRSLSVHWDTGDMFLYLLANMAAQGEHYRATYRATGVMVVVWSFAAFVFVNCYSSTLASFLLVSYTAPAINSIADLAGSSSALPVVLKGSFTEIDILNSTSGTFRELANKLLRCPRCRSTDFTEIRRMVLHEHFVGILPSSSALGMILTDLDRTRSCHLTLANENYGWMPMYFGFPKDGRFVSEITGESLWVDAYGLISKWKANERYPIKCLFKYNKKGVYAQSYSAPLKLQQFLPPFAIVIIGYIVASIAFVSERIRG